MTKGRINIITEMNDFDRKYLNETNMDKLGNFWVVEYPGDVREYNMEDEMLNICYETNVDSLILQSKGGLNEEDIYMITHDEEEAKEEARILIQKKIEGAAVPDEDDMMNEIYENEADGVTKTQKTREDITEDIDMGFDDFSSFDQNTYGMDNKNRLTSIDNLYNQFGGDRVYGHKEWKTKCERESTYGDDIHFIPLSSVDGEICINTYSNQVIGAFQSSNTGKDEGVVFKEGTAEDFSIKDIKKSLGA